MKNTSKLARTRETRHLSDLTLNVSLPGELEFHRTFNYATRAGLCYSGISFSREVKGRDEKKVVFNLPRHEIPEHIVGYTFGVRNDAGKTKVFLHLFYRMTNGHF
ncbi:hypothetical protein FJZ17_02225 [Candidatus Pacearchaeota archaeon]|nr:hypothetical protein [Candidatus Pacearchaeota archaeon]